MLNLDTHILIHALNDQLTPKEAKLLSRETWSISPIVLWEIYKLNQLNRIEFDIEDSDFAAVLANIHIWPMNVQVIKTLKKLDFRSDPADELIAATSIAFNVPLVTRDERILKSKIVPFFSKHKK